MIEFQRNESASSALSWSNPTRARITLPHPGHTEGPYDSQIPGASVEWRSRDNRKGRHTLIIPKAAAKGDDPTPQITSELSAVAKGIWRMCTVFAWWDVSWWIGMLFSVGSAIFVACGFFYWLPLAAPSTEFHDEAFIAGGVTAFVGATLFQIGAVLLIVEACNENQPGCFGWALEQAFSHSDSDPETSTNDKLSTPTTPTARKTGLNTTTYQNCNHHHAHGAHKRSAIALQHPDSNRKWEWWPTWHELHTHYLHEIGFLGSFILAVGATIFYISGIMALPGIYNNISTPVLYGTYWLAYLVGGILFVVSSVLVCVRDAAEMVCACAASAGLVDWGVEYDWECGVDVERGVWVLHAELVWVSE